MKDRDWSWVPAFVVQVAIIIFMVGLLVVPLLAILVKEARVLMLWALR